MDIKLVANDSSKERILELIRANPFIPQQEMADRLGLMRSSVASHIAQLIREHRLLGRAYLLPQEEPILVAGGANLDRIGKCVDPVMLGTTNPVAMEETYGGVARNVAENLVRLGLPVRLLTAVGDDDHGNRLLKHALDLGIDTSLCLAFRGATTGTYTATLKPNGELVLAMADMAVIEQLTPGIIAERRSRWSASRLRVADMNLPMPALVELIEDSLHRSATLVCVAVSEPKLKRLPLSLKGISVLILNRGELGARVGCRLESMGAIEEACRTVLNQGLESLVVTMDKDGVFCCSAKGRPRHLKAPKARIVDVTGAGDAFSSGVVAALASHPEDLVRACNIGQHLAAVTLESHASVSPRLSPTFLKECEAAYPPAKQ